MPSPRRQRRFPSPEPYQAWPDTGCSIARADLSASSTVPASVPLAGDWESGAGDPVRHGSRSPIPRDDNSPLRSPGRKSAARSSRADRRRRSIRSADRPPTASAARSAPAIVRASSVRPGWSRAAPARSRPAHLAEARSTRLAQRDYRWRLARNRSPGPGRQAALPLTGMRRTFSFAASVFGRVTVNTPFLKVAAAWSRSIPCGSPIRRSKRP